MVTGILGAAFLSDEAIQAYEDLNPDAATSDIMAGGLHQ